MPLATATSAVQYILYAVRVHWTTSFPRYLNAQAHAGDLSTGNLPPSGTSGMGAGLPDGPALPELSQEEFYDLLPDGLLRFGGRGAQVGRHDDTFPIQERRGARRLL